MIDTVFGKNVGCMY